MTCIIDAHGYRANVGIILTNNDKQVLWARRMGQNAWQFPQGGMQTHETPEQALWRELDEEIGLNKHDADIVAVSHRWLRYRLPKRLIRHHAHPLCIGQKQKWFLLRLTQPDSHINLATSAEPEFCEWRWVDFWHPLSEVVSFKHRVYLLALQEFASILFPET